MLAITNKPDILDRHSFSLKGGLQQLAVAAYLSKISLCRLVSMSGRWVLSLPCLSCYAVF